MGAPRDAETETSGGRPAARIRAARCRLALIVALSAAALIWPGPMLVADRVRPFVLGLPFAFAWSVGWLLVTFAALAVYHVRHEERG